MIFIAIVVIRCLQSVCRNILFRQCMCSEPMVARACVLKASVVAERALGGRDLRSAE